jgi:hypothetical protein
MYSPLMLFGITARPYYRSTDTDARLSTLRSPVGGQFARDAIDIDALHCPHASEVSNYVGLTLSDKELA